MSTQKPSDGMIQATLWMTPAQTKVVKQFLDAHRTSKPTTQAWLENSILGIIRMAMDDQNHGGDDGSPKPR